MRKRLSCIAFAAAAVAAVPSSPLVAEIGQGVPQTRLQQCGAETCLAVTGRRQDAAAPILLAGHKVQAQGKHSWKALVPVDAIRDWSAPFARTIVVQVEGEHEARAPLPVGLLGNNTMLSFLEVSAHP